MDKKFLRKFRWLFFLMKLKIPMLGFARPKVIHLDENTVRVKIKLKRRTKNHLNSMYLGALVVGADLAAGVHAFYYTEKMNKKVSFAFKGMQSEYLMRAESDVVFETNDGLLMKKAIEQSIKTGERVNQSIKVKALDSYKNVVANFEMISSVKCK